jgi:uncharacterized protein YfdQ (DUF2303 family)
MKERTTMSESSDPVAYGNWLKEQLAFHEFTNLPHPEDPELTIPALVTQTKDGAMVRSVRKVIDEWRTRPERRTGTATLHDLTSFVDHVQRFKDRGSAIFADGSNPAAPLLAAVLNYHEAVNLPVPTSPDIVREILLLTEQALDVDDAADPGGAASVVNRAIASVKDGLEDHDRNIERHFTHSTRPSTHSSLPRFGDHRAVYRFPLSDEWKVWTGKNGQKMGQADFAEFLEDHIGDVIHPPSAEQIEERIVASRALSQGTTMSAMEFAKLMGGTFATPARLIELSRGLEIRQNQTAKQIINTSTGEVEVLYQTQNVDEKGQPIKIPNLFLIAVPVFKNGTVFFEVVVRLRTRLDRGNLTWTFEMYRLDSMFRHAFEDAAHEARDATGLPLFFGSPE